MTLSSGPVGTEDTRSSAGAGPGAPGSLRVLMALLAMPPLCLQVESELHRRHVVEAWGDQLKQKKQVCYGGPGVSGHWCSGRTPGAPELAGRLWKE